MSRIKEYASGIFQKIRDAESLHHEKLQEECQNQLERFIRNEVPDSYTETLKMLFVDKDAIANGTDLSYTVRPVSFYGKTDKLTNICDLTGISSLPYKVPW